MISSSVTLSVPFFMGKIIDVIQNEYSKGGLQETLQPYLILLSSVFMFGALANVGRIYLLQMSGEILVWLIVEIAVYVINGKMDFIHLDTMKRFLA